MRRVTRSVHHRTYICLRQKENGEDLLACSWSVAAASLIIIIYLRKSLVRTIVNDLEDSEKCLFLLFCTCESLLFFPSGSQ